MIVPATGAPPTAGQTSDDRLRAAAQQLEGVFLSHLFKAMRAATPEGGLFEGGPGQDVYTEMFDEHLADALATKLKGSLGDMLYRQLLGRAEMLDHQPGG